jgi:TP901 family phage tail tape measure protein
MTDIATLKIVVQADGTAKVAGDLDRLTQSSAKAEKGFMGLAGTASKLARSLGLMVGVGTIATTFTKATSAAMDFETAMAEVGTLTDTMDMDRLTQSVRDLSQEFGADRIESAKALYQVISAGASTAADATNILTVANKLAVGGVTSVDVAADGLTSAMNAYGKAAGEAGSISDAMFVAMKAGKTTIEELSSNVGKLAPIAAQAGMSFDELMAATAAVTKTGLNTSMTMNSLRQVLANVIKPTKEASDTAAQLGIQFDVAAIQTKGFTGFLQEVVEKTGAAPEALSKLFGSVESLQSILYLASETGRNEFLTVMTQMEEKSGATQAAFDEMSETAGFLAGKLKQQLGNALLSLGTTTLEYLTPALLSLVTNFETVLATAVTLGQILLTGVLAKGLLALPGLFATVSGAALTAAGAIKTFTLAIAANPLGLLLVALSTAVAALVIFRNEMVTVGETTATVGEYMSATWKHVSSVIMDVFGGAFEFIGNVVGFFVDSFTSNMDEIGEAWFGGISDMDVSWRDMINNALRVFDWGIRVMLGLLDELWQGAGNVVGNISKLFTALGTDLKNALTGDFSFSNVTQAFHNEMVPLSFEIQDVFSEAWEVVEGRDYIEGTVQGLKTLGREIANTVEEGRELKETTSETEQAITDLGTQADKTGDAVGRSSEEVRALLEASDDTEKKVKQTTEALQEQEKEANPWADAMVHAVERIDGAFVNLWRNIGSGWDSFKTALLDSFSQLLAEMAHMAITKPIVMNIAAGITGGVAGTATAATASGLASGGGLMGIWQGVKGGFNAALGGLSNVYQDVGNMLYDLGAEGLGDALANRGIRFEQGGLTGGWTGVGLDIGAGYLGNMAGRAVFGNENSTGIGSAVGGFVGSAYGPLGTAAGAFLGEGFETLLGNVLGFGGTSNNRVYADIAEGIVGETYVTDKGNHSAQRKAVETVMGPIQAMLDAVGAEDFEGRISASAKHGLEYDGMRTKDSEKFFGKVFEDIINSSKDMSSSMRELLLSFDGTSMELLAFTDVMMQLRDPSEEVSSVLSEMILGFEGTNEQLLEFAVGMAQLEKMLETNAATTAIEDYATAMENAGRTMTTVYNEQVNSVATLITEFDGSAAAATELASEFGNMKIMAYELVTALLAAKDAIADLTGSSANRLRESVMTDEELYTKWNLERTALEASLAGMTDPEEISNTVGAIVDLTNKMFNILPEDEQIANAESFATYIEGIGETASGIIDSVITGLTDDQTIMTQAATDMMSAVGTFGSAVDNFSVHVSSLQGSVSSLSGVVSSLQSKGIPVTVDVNLSGNSEIAG